MMKIANRLLILGLCSLAASPARAPANEHAVQPRPQLPVTTKKERPESVIRWIDRVNKLVWINLGALDKLKKGAAFQVYPKKSRGDDARQRVAKGTIQVTRLIGPHLSEAKITRDDAKNPMTLGDLVLKQRQDPMLPKQTPHETPDNSKRPPKTLLQEHWERNEPFYWDGRWNPSRRRMAPNTPSTPTFAPAKERD